jgi:hypothetical protein
MVGVRGRMHTRSKQSVDSSEVLLYDTDRGVNVVKVSLE